MLPICGLMWFLRKPCEVLNVDDRSFVLRSSPSRHQANSPRRLPVSVSWATVYRPSRRPLLRLRMLPYRSIHRSFVRSLSKAMCHVGEYRQCLITAQPVTGKCGSLYLCRDSPADVLADPSCRQSGVRPCSSLSPLFHRNLFRYTSRRSTR